jgi:hypothetical protein
MSAYAVITGRAHHRILVQWVALIRWISRARSLNPNIMTVDESRIVKLSF